MNPKVVLPMFGSRDSDFAILPGLVGRRRRPGSLLAPFGGPAGSFHAILLENGNDLLAESGNYLQTET